ncbi:hypothetical protein ACFYU8_18320 [Brevibacillus sp. NPDC003359]|uniref:hypothetical protein n=1 Tax=unclassified Brevibacillus TaxID=2684853 RepID=UPI0036A4A863
MAGYKVTMKDSDSGIYIRHVEANNEQRAIKYANRYFHGECICVVEKEFADQSFPVTQMVDGVYYEIIADHEYTNDIVGFTKNGDRLTVTIKGGDFPEDGQQFFFDLSIVNTVNYCEEYDISSLTLYDLEHVEFEIYSQIATLQVIPDRYQGKVGTL